MGKKSDAAKASLAVAFLAAGGTVAVGASAATENPEAVVSSYFGGIGLRDNFQGYLKLTTPYESFYKYYKLEQNAAIRTVQKFSLKYEVAPPPGFEISTTSRQPGGPFCAYGVPVPRAPGFAMSTGGPLRRASLRPPVCRSGASTLDP